MLKRLNPNQEEKLREKFHDHPLFLTCQKAFHHYMASMEQFIFSEEKMFVEVVTMIDEIFADPNNAGAYIEEHWDNLKIRLKASVQPTPPQGDLDIVCGILYYIVAATFSLHWNSFYNTEVVGLLRDRVLSKELFREQGEQETIIDNLCTYSQGLDGWINEYEDSGVWLSEVIDDALAEKEIKSNAKERKFTPTGQTFQKSSLITDIQIDIIGQRLAQANKLEASPDDFRKLFSGVNSQFAMKWLGAPGELRDLFKMLTGLKSGNSAYIKPKRGYQLILQSHFVDKNGNIINDLNGQKSIDAFKSIIIDCEYLIQHVTESFSQEMKEIVNSNHKALEDTGYFTNSYSAKQEGLRIKNRF